MRYQVGADGEPLKCTKCGEWLRSHPVYDTFPVCARATCGNAERLGKAVHDVMTSIYGLPVQSSVVTGGEAQGGERPVPDAGRHEVRRSPPLVTISPSAVGARVRLKSDGSEHGIESVLIIYGLTSGAYMSSDLFELLSENDSEMGAHGEHHVSRLQAGELSERDEQLVRDKADAEIIRRYWIRNYGWEPIPGGDDKDVADLQAAIDEARNDERRRCSEAAEKVR